MSTPYQKKSGSKVEFTLSITKDAVTKAEKQVIQEFRPYVGAKGFRKGHAPDEVVIASLSPQRISLEALEKAIEKEYRKFIEEQKLQPIQSPKLDIKDAKKDPVEIKVEVEIFPEVNLGNYKKIKMGPLNTEVKEEEIEKVLEKIMADMGIFKKVDRKAKKGDFLEVDFCGFDDKGNEIPNTKAEKTTFIAGSGQFLEDLEKAYEGMSAGEEKTKVKVEFPKQYPSPDLAGKKVPFSIKLHEVREINSKNLTDADIEKIAGAKKTRDELKKDIVEMMSARKKEEEKKKSIEQYNKELAKQVKIDLPTSWIREEVNIRLQEIKNTDEYKKDPENFWKNIGKKEEELVKQFHQFSEENLKVFLGLSEIIKQENIELDKDELEKAFQIWSYQKQKNNHMTKEQELSALDRITLNLKIDKYFAGLTLEEEIKK